MATTDGHESTRGLSPACERRHEVSGEESLSATIIDAVAAAHGVDPTDCDLGLYEAVDLEALDVLFERRTCGDHWRFEFEVNGYIVAVEGDGRVAVYDG